MSIRLPQISSAQCKRARAMLKWNPQDLASRGRIQVKRIEMFERNQLRLTRTENDEVVKLFQKFHITFRPGNEVVFMSSAPGNQSRASIPAQASAPSSYTVTLADGVTQVRIGTGDDWGEVNAAQRQAEESET